MINIRSNFAVLLALFSVCSIAHAEVTVSDAWVRGTVSGQTATGSFMSIKSTEDAMLVSAASPVAGMVQIHKMEMKGEMMSMAPVKELAIPAGKTVELKPGSYHVMLMDLKHPLTKGEQVPLTLSFTTKNGGKQTIELNAEVRELTAH